MIQSTQRKMLRLIIQTNKKYKKIEKQDIETKEENEEIDINEMCSIDDESGDGQSTKSKDDVDSEVTFDEDSDKEMDTIEIEEEDWIEYIKRSTADALDKMERAKIRCWNRTHKKWSGNWHWESQHHRVKDGWKRLLNGTQIWVQDIGPTERLEDREKDGKTTSMISSNKYLKKGKMKNQSKAAITPPKLGST